MMTAIKNYELDMNTGFFLNLGCYQPYFTYLGNPLEIDSTNCDLNLVSIEILRWLCEANYKSGHLLLDYACGIPSLLVYTNEMGIDSR